MSEIYKNATIFKDTREIEIYEACWHSDSDNAVFPVVRVEVSTLMPSYVVRNLLAEILLSIPER